MELALFVYLAGVVGKVGGVFFCNSNYQRTHRFYVWNLHSCK